MDEQPFSDLKITPYEFLDSLKGRSECPKCKRSRKYYCYTCYVPVDQLHGKIPSLKLPLKIDIIKHPSEVDGKSTSAHAKVLAPDDVSIFTYPCIPDYPRDGSVVFVFPGEDVSTLDDLAAKHLQKIDVQKSNKLESTNSTDSTNRDEQACCSVAKESEKNVNTNELAQNSDPARSSESNNQTDQSCLSVTDSDKFAQETCKNLDPDSNDIPKLNTEKQSLSQSPNGTSGEITQDDDILPNRNDCSDISESAQVDRKRKMENEDEVQTKKICFPAFKKAVFIDSTWSQTNRISTDERLKGLPCVMLKDRETRFWRHQKDYPASYLSTIEAIYYLVRDYHDLFIATNYNGEYDNLLFFFAYMYDKIHGLYGDRTLKADARRKKLKN